MKDKDLGETRRSKKGNLIISHGFSEHTAQAKDDCMKCIEVQLNYYQDLKRAGGITKLLESGEV